MSWWRRHRREVALGGHDNPAAAAGDPALDSSLVAALRRLPLRQRQVIALRLLLDLDTATSAEMLGRADRRRTRRWLAATAAATCAAIGLTLGLALPSGSQIQPVHVHLAAWSVDTSPDGDVTITLRNISDPGRLQQVLSEAGIPATVRWGEMCRAEGQHSLLSTEGFVKLAISGMRIARREQPVSVFMLYGGHGVNKPLNWSWTITPSKIPAGGQFVLSAIPAKDASARQIRAEWEFVTSSAPVTCATSGS